MESRNWSRVIPEVSSGSNVRNSQEPTIWLTKAENSVDFGSIWKVASFWIPCWRISFSRIFKALLSFLKILKNSQTNRRAPSSPALDHIVQRRRQAELLYFEEFLTSLGRDLDLLNELTHHQQVFLELVNLNLEHGDIYLEVEFKLLWPIVCLTNSISLVSFHNWEI